MPGSNKSPEAFAARGLTAMGGPDFAQFRTFGEECLESAVREARKFVQALVANPWAGGYCLSLIGCSGNGKTMLARCALQAVQANPWGSCNVIPPLEAKGHRQNFEWRYRDWRRISEKLKNWEWDVIDGMEEPQLLVIDDIGADYDPKKIAAGKLDRLLRAREGKWTIVTSNLLLSGIGAEIDTRISSFLIRDGNRFVELNTTDFWLRS